MLFSLSNLKRRFAFVPLLLLGLTAVLLFDRYIRDLIRRLGPVLRGDEGGKHLTSAGNTSGLSMSENYAEDRSSGQIEVYVLSRRRDEETINRFLDAYVDREASEDREGEELMMEPLEGDEELICHHTWSWEDYDWEPARTLSHAVKLGLDYPRRAFALYLETKDSEFNQAVLCFTTDDQLVIGVFFEDTRQRAKQALQLLPLLMQEYEGVLGLISYFEYPPRSEAAFRAMKGKPGVLHFVERPAT